MMSPSSTATENKRISNVYGARGGYIANALSNVAIHYFLLWAAVFVAVILLLNKGLTLLTSTKGAVKDAVKQDKLLMKGNGSGGISVDFAASAAEAQQRENQQHQTTHHGAAAHADTDLL